MRCIVRVGKGQYEVCKRQSHSPSRRHGQRRRPCGSGWLGLGSTDKVKVRGRGGEGGRVRFNISVGLGLGSHKGKLESD